MVMGRCGSWSNPGGRRSPRSFTGTKDDRYRITGSVARGEERPGSDIVFLVQFEPGSSLFDLMDLEAALEELLGVQVDVVSEGGLKGRDRQLREEAVSVV